MRPLDFVRPVGTLSPLVTPPPQRLMAVIRAYLDDSGYPTDPNTRVMAIAGYAAKQAHWTYFEEAWAKVLGDFGVPYFHMKEWPNPKGILAAIKSDPVLEHDFIVGLAGAITDWLDSSPSAVVRLDDLEEFNERHELEIDPYALAIYGCLFELGTEYYGQEVDLVIDRFDKSPMRIALGFEYAQTDSSGLDISLFNSIALGGSDSWRNILPLQAADFVAYELRKNVDERKGFRFNRNDGTGTAQYNIWIEGLVGSGERLPRYRKSFRAIAESPALRPRGVVWDIDHLEDALKRHPNGWRTPSPPTHRKARAQRHRQMRSPRDPEQPS